MVLDVEGHGAAEETMLRVAQVSTLQWSLKGASGVLGPQQLCECHTKVMVFSVFGFEKALP